MTDDIPLQEKELLQVKDDKDNQSEEIEEREEWGNKLDFLLSCIGYAVGFGNVWRFPNLCFENGGGAFLIPYFFFLTICGMPLFFMELSLSQYVGIGPIGCWKAVSPLLKGIGYAMLLISFFVTIYYNAIIAWVFYYLFESFRADVPWRDCSNYWNTEDCYEGPPKSTIINVINSTMANTTASCPKNFMLTSMKLLNDTLVGNVNGTLSRCVYQQPSTRVLPASEYLNDYVLQKSTGIGEAGEVRWQLCLCLLLAWITVYFCIWKGTASVGKVVYVTATFPYLVLFILFIRGVTLSGAGKGVVYYLYPDFKKLLEPQVWVRAASQIFYSLGVGFGSLIAMGSYNKFNNNVYRDAVLVSLINCATSVFCGFVVFSVLGHMSEVLNLPIRDVAESGPGLVFIVYPAGIAQMPVSTLWAILFFLMLLTIGLDSQFAMMECVISGLSDEYPRYLRKYKEVFILIMCIIAFFLGIPNVTQAGPYIVELFNTQAGGVSLVFLAFFEVIAVGWIYGADRLLDNIEVMIGYRPSVWWKICWKYISPIVILVTFLYGIVMWDGIKYGDYTYPGWSEFIGWMLALVSMFCIPAGMIHEIWCYYKKKSYSPGAQPAGWREMFYELTKPDESRLKELENMRVTPIDDKEALA